MTKTFLFRLTIIVTVIMMMVGGSLMNEQTVYLGISMVALGVAGFILSPVIAQLGKDEEKK